jgi:hypothetical protein
MSKAGEWYVAQMRVDRSYAVTKGLSAQVVIVEHDGPRLEIALDKVSVLPSAQEAVAFGRWLLDTFGEGTT